MYTIFCDGVCIFSNNTPSDQVQIVEASLSLEDNSTGSLDFKVIPSSDVTINRMKSKITVFRDDEELFEGRAISEESDFMENVSYHCEGCLAYLLDTLQEPETYEGTVPEFLKKMVDSHNGKVSDDKKFVLGYVSTEYTDKTVSVEINYDKTLDIINSVLTDSEDSDLKGHLYVRFQNGERHLDYIKSGSNTNSQVVQFGDNLLDLSKNYDESSLSTVILPLGGEIEVEVDEETTETKRIDISSVNGGSKYLANDELVSKYGRIEQLVEFDDITEPAKLLEQANLWFADQQFEEMELEVSVMDLHYRNPDLQPFHMLDNVRCVSRYHGMDRYFPVTKMEIDLCNPDGTRITFNETKSQNISTSTARTGEVIDAKIKDIPKVDEDAILKEAQRNATELLNTAMTGYVTLVKNDQDGHLEAIIISDTEDYTQSTNLWRWNVNGFAHSRNGGVLWDTAITMDGQMVADFITTGTMSADRIRGGSLVIGGSGGHNGSIKVYNDNGDLIGQWDKDGAYIQTGNSSGESIKLQRGLFSVMNNGLEIGYMNANQSIIVDDETNRGIRISGRGGIIFRGPVFGVGQEGFLEHTQGGLYDLCGNGTIPVLTNVYTEDGKIKYEYRNIKFNRGMMVSDLGGNPAYGGGDDEPNVNPSLPTIDQDEIESRHKSNMRTFNRFPSDIIVPGDQAYKPGMSILDAFPALESDYYSYWKNVDNRNYLSIVICKVYNMFLGLGMMSISENCTRSSKRANVGRVIGELVYDSGAGKYKYGSQILPDTPLIECGLVRTSTSVSAPPSYLSDMVKNSSLHDSYFNYVLKNASVSYQGGPLLENPSSYALNTFTDSYYVFVGYYYDSWYICMFHIDTSKTLSFYYIDGSNWYTRYLYPLVVFDLWNESEAYDHQQIGQYLKDKDEPFEDGLILAGLPVRSDFPNGFTPSTAYPADAMNYIARSFLENQNPYYYNSIRSTIVLNNNKNYSRPDKYSDGTAFDFYYYFNWWTNGALTAFQMYFENGSLFIQLGVCWAEGASGTFRSKYRLFDKIFFINRATNNGTEYILPRCKIHPSVVQKIPGKLDHSGIYRFSTLANAQSFYSDLLYAVNT